MNKHILKNIKSSIRFSVLMTITLLCCNSHSYAQATNIETLTVRYNQSRYLPKEINYDYYSALLKLALDQTVTEFSPYKMLPIYINDPQQRTIHMLEKINQRYLD